MLQPLLNEPPEKTKQRSDHRTPQSARKQLFQGTSGLLLQLQRTLGNQRLTQLIQARRITSDGKISALQPWPTVGASSDQYEPEADWVTSQEKQMQSVRPLSNPTLSTGQVSHQNTRNFANCEGVNISGHTDANYSHSYTAPGSSTARQGCTDCAADECITNTGTVISIFNTNPQITLPRVPGGLNECEQIAVQNFINTTLQRHEQRHVAVFNTYRGTVRTPYTYRGCANGLDAHTQQIHDRIEAARRASADTASAALDANGANNFTITCRCPRPAPAPEAEANPTLPVGE